MSVLAQWPAHPAFSQISQKWACRWRRPLMYGLAVGGAGGVNGVMKFMNRELVNTVPHCGVESIGKLNESHVRRA